TLKLCTACLQVCYSPVLSAYLKHVISSVTPNAVPELTDRSSIYIYILYGAHLIIRS
ncbi:hypothetical protein C0J52_09732, partial [Blattella germanica]